MIKFQKLLQLVRIIHQINNSEKDNVYLKKHGEKAYQLGNYKAGLKLYCSYRNEFRKHWKEYSLLILIVYTNSTSSYKHVQSFDNTVSDCTTVLIQNIPM